MSCGSPGAPEYSASEGVMDRFDPRWDDDRDRRDDSNSGDDRDVSTQRRNEPDQPDVDRPTPADIAHDRWTTGRCWVPIRLRNTQ